MIGLSLDVSNPESKPNHHKSAIIYQSNRGGFRNNDFKLSGSESAL